MKNPAANKFAFPACLAAGLGFNSTQQQPSEGLMMIYLICLVVGLVFTLVSVVAGHFFGGHGDHVGGSGGHAEAGADSSDMPGISIFSPTIIASFITAFGGFGLIFSEIPPTKQGDRQRAAVHGLRPGALRACCLCFCARCSATRKVPANRTSPQLAGTEASVVVAHPRKWRRRNRLCRQRHALHRAGAHGKWRGHRQRQAGQNHARRRHAILRRTAN